jgi:hypothetical protein
MSEEIKNCPFCGERGTIKETSDGGHYIFCENFDCVVNPRTDFAPSRIFALKYWNNRAENDCEYKFKYKREDIVAFIRHQWLYCLNKVSFNVSQILDEEGESKYHTSDDMHKRYI